MKKLITILLIALTFVVNVSGQTDIIISGIVANPAGTDSNIEYIQLTATKNIDFTATPYSVVISNNGTATSNGWVSGAALSYGFNLNSGSVTVGGVFYVGGSGKLLNGVGSLDISTENWIGTINTSITGGDGFGNFNASGVFGNGGSNADGIAVFSGLTSSILASTTPIDAIFYGASVGTANPASGGYVLPTNDRYNNAQGTFGDGTNTYLFPDPSSGQIIKMSGDFDVNAQTWITPRTGVNTTLTSLITLAPSLTLSGLVLTSSSAKAITSFSVAGVNANINGLNITATVPFGTTLNGIAPSGIISALATANPSFSTTQDFGSLVNYTVTAEDLSSQIYTVSVTSLPAISQAKNITTLTVAGVAANINGLSITVNVPFGTNVIGIAPMGTISALATVNPSFATNQDFTSLVNYTVTAEDLTSQVYVVSVTSLLASSASSITGFTLQGGYAGIITGTTIAINVPFGTNLSSLTATGVASPFATVNPAFNTALNYGSAQVFTVTAQNMSMAYYTVTVTSLPSVAGFNGIIESFTTDPVSSGWSIYTPKSLKNWLYSSSNGNIEANGFGSTGISAMESWLITPKLTFAGASQAIAYGGTFEFSDANTPKPAQVLYSNNYIGSGPVSIAGWSVIADDYQGIVTVAGFKNFTSTGTGYIAFVYKASGTGSGQGIRWRLDNVSISGASLFTPTVTGLVYNVEANMPPGITLTGIQPISFLRNSIDPSTGLTTLSGSLVITIAGRVTGPNQRGTQAGYQYRIIDGDGYGVVFRNTTSVAGLTFTDGDLVTVSGTLGHFNGLLQLNSASYIKGENVTQRQVPVVVSALTENIESKIVTMVASSVNKSTWNDAPSTGFDFQVTVAGVPTLVRIQTYHTDVYGKTYEQVFGSVSNTTNITITGFVGQFDNSNPHTIGYQLEPYLASDIAATLPTLPSTLAGFTSIYFPAQASNGLASQANGTVNGSNIDFALPSNVTVNGLLMFFTLDASASASISSGSTPQFLYNTADKIYYTDVVVTAQAGNIAQYRINVTVAPGSVTGINTGTQLSNVLVYPNPAEESFYIQSPVDALLVIQSLEGATKLESVVAKGIQTIHVAALPKGLYLVQVLSAEGVATFKISIK